MIPLFLMVATAQMPAAPSAATATPPPVVEWPTLPHYPLPRGSVLPDGAFVQAEVEAGRCSAVQPEADGNHVESPVAILVGANGIVRQIVPQAIGCPTVEQYTVGYLLSMTRSGSANAAATTPGWYRLTIAYRW